MEDKELFNKIASKYAQKDIYSVSRLARKFQINTLMGLSPEIENKVFENTLEIGCGNGANSAYISKSYKKYTGVDFSKELIEIANNLYTNNTARFRCDDISNIKPDNYDLIISVGVLHHLEDLDKSLSHISTLGNTDSVFLFLEPQGKNPIIQLLRYIRKLTDTSYSKTQRFFIKSDLESAITKANLEIIKIKYTGYFTPPFAQAILKPAFIFSPILKFFIIIDRFIQNNFSNFLSWNISLAVRKKRAN